MRVIQFIGSVTRRFTKSTKMISRLSDPRLLILGAETSNQRVNFVQGCRRFSSKGLLSESATDEEIYNFMKYNSKNWSNVAGVFPPISVQGKDMCTYDAFAHLYSAEKFIATSGMEPRIPLAGQYMSDVFYDTPEDMEAMAICQHFIKNGIPTVDEYPYEEPRSHAPVRLAKFNQNVGKALPLRIHEARFVTYNNLPACLNALTRGPVYIGFDAPKEEYGLVCHNEYGVSVFRGEWSQHLHIDLQNLKFLDGHAAIATGFGVCPLTGMAYLEIRNNWGEWFGDVGHFWLEVVFGLELGVWGCLSTVIEVFYYPRSSCVRLTC